MLQECCERHFQVAFRAIEHEDEIDVVKWRLPNLDERLDAAFVCQVVDRAKVIVHLSAGLLRSFLVSPENTVDIPLGKMLPGYIAVESDTLVVFLRAAC
jgi:hypothetical protein